MKKLLLLVFAAVFIYSCNKDNPVSNETPVSSDYVKLFTVDSAGMKYEFYSKTGSSLFVGYNEIGFRVYQNGTEQKTGYVNYVPVMFHTTGPGHGTPVSSKFNYNESEGLFTGYASYIMLSDSTSRWFGDYGYNDLDFIRHREFSVIPGTGNQMHYWLDAAGSGMLYLLTIVAPKDALVGLNDFKCILHSTVDQFTYNEVDSASMYIKPWMPSHGHGSSSNTNPAFQSHGMYKGVANFTMAGQWYLYDSISVNGNFITPNPTFYFVFDVR